MKNFKVSFFKVEREVNDKGLLLGKTYSHQGSVVIDDNNVSNTFTLATKAYRACPHFSFCDKLEIREIK